MKDINIELLMGLPGSGKTHYAKEKEDKNNGTYAVILDDLADIQCQCYGKHKPVTELIQLGCRNIHNRARTIILDGLFLTNEQVILALRSVAQEFKSVDVVIHQWNEDREICLKNDGGRREASSSITIQSALYELIDVNYINQRLFDSNVQITKVIKHTVELKPDWQRYWRPHVWHDDGKLRSPSWHTGGYWGDCWGGKHPVSPEDPYNFDKLDELLEKVAPKLTFLQYKRIQQECVSTEITDKCDYYGGYIHCCNWVCDLEALYSLLEQYGYTTT